MGLFLGLGLYMIAPFMQAFVIGAILALVVRPLYALLRRRRLGVHLSATVSTLTLLLLIIGPFLFLTVVGIRQAVEIVQVLSKADYLSFKEALLKVSLWGPIQRLSINPEELTAYLTEIFEYIGSVGTKFILGLGSSIPSGILQLILACMTCYCLLTDGRKFSQWVFSKIPMDVEIRDHVSKSFKNTAISVVMASMAAAGAQSIIIMTGFLVLQVPSAFFAAGVTFILSWIPMVGAAPVWLTAAGYLFLNGHYIKAVIMVAFGILTSTIDNFIRPLVLKGRGEMHPLVSLIAIFGGLHLFGFFGVFLGPILIAIVISLLQLWPVIGRPFGLVFAAESTPDITLIEK